MIRVDRPHRPRGIQWGPGNAESDGELAWTSSQRAPHGPQQQLAPQPVRRLLAEA